MVRYFISRCVYNKTHKYFNGSKKTSFTVLIRNWFGTISNRKEIQSNFKHPSVYEGQTKKKDTFAIELTSSRAVGRSENSGEQVIWWAWLE